VELNSIATLGLYPDARPETRPTLFENLPPNAAT
jgi:hypothetical protein